MKEHKLYQNALAAFRNTSFYAEKRAEDTLKDYEDRKGELKEAGASEEQLQKFESLFVDWLGASSRCASPMVVGPAKFPFERNRKRIDSEIKKLDLYINFFRRAKQSLAEKNSPKETREQFLLAKIEKAKKDLAEPPRHSYSYTYARKHIREAEAELATLKKLGEAFPEKDFKYGEVQVFLNEEDDRIQLFFDEKPSEETRAFLKSKAFKWAPSVGAWQRQMTPIALSILKSQVLPNLK